MEAAGQLLETHPLHEDPESLWGSFSDWLEHRASLDAKGDWLADHRQMPPLDAIEFPVHKENVWPVPSAKNYALSRLVAHTGAIVVAGRWTQYQGRNSETLRVESAFASRARAGALSRALATVRNPHDYALPDFQDSHEIHHGDFILEGWVAESGAESGADTDDPWTGGLARRFPDIAGPVGADLGIVRDDASGMWRQDDGTCVAWVERWSEGADDERGCTPSGERLMFDRQFLQNVLDRQERTLILEVTCHRNVVPYNYESGSGDAEKEHSTSIITIEKARAPRLVGRNVRPRKKTRRRTKAR